MNIHYRPGHKSLEPWSSHVCSLLDLGMGERLVGHAAGKVGYAGYPHRFKAAVPCRHSLAGGGHTHSVRTHYPHHAHLAGGLILRACELHVNALPERYVKSPIYDVRFDWYQGLCWAEITLDLRVDGFDPTGIDLNRRETLGRLQQEALRIAEEYLSDPPIPVNLSFALMFRDGSPKSVIPVGIFPKESERKGS